MKWLSLLALALLATSAQAQAQSADASPPLIVHVYDDDGTPTFTVEGRIGSNGPLLSAGGVMVVRAADGLEALVIVEPNVSSYSFTAFGTGGPNAASARPGEPGVLQAPPPRERATPDYVHVSVYVCTSYATLPPDAPEWESPACQTWQALLSDSATDGRPGFTLEVNYGVGIYAPAPPSIPDPPMEPDDPQD